MRNLLDIPLEHHDLYRKAASQWREKVVGGFMLTALGITPIIAVEASRYAGELNDVLSFFGVMALSGAGITGYGIAELKNTSDELASRTNTDETALPEA
jgi:hypothetical protein